MTASSTEPRHAVRLYRLLRRHPVVEALAAAAGPTPTHLVGGLLRDRLLGLPSRDLDAVVAGRGRAIAENAAAALGATLVPLGGKEFAAFRLVGPDWVLDLWDRDGVPLEADLARRDFTVNSFALALDGGRLIDPFGGVADLGRRLLRATTAASFTGDPLRVLRLPRFVAKLPGFTADPETLALARAAAPGLAAVAAERVREELALIFKSDEAARVLALMAALDVYPGLWLGAPGSPGEGGAAVRELSALAGALRELAAVDPAAAAAADRLTARLAATFAALPAHAGAAGTRAAAGVGEPAVAARAATVDAAVRSTPAAEAAARFAAAGYLTRRVAERVQRVLAEPILPTGELVQRRFLHRLGELWPTAAVRLGAAAAADPPAHETWRRRLRELAALAKRAGAEVFDPPRLLGGEEVQDLLGVGPGPQVGEALAAVRAAQVEGRIRTREQALALITSRSAAG